MTTGYTILSAQYSDEDNKSVTIQTKEFGAVSISAADRPELWAQLPLVTVSAYVPPVVSVAVTPADAPPTDGPNVLA